MIYEWILLITLNDTQPIIGHFKNLKECQYVAKVYATDRVKQGGFDLLMYSHCIKVEKQ